MSNESTSDDEMEQNNDENECKICKRVCTSKKRLDRHLMTIHSKKRSTFKCNDCKKVFAEKWTMKKHIERVHLGVKLFKCPECPLSFGDKGTLKGHIQSFHTEDDLKEKATCPICGKVFSGSRPDHSLRNHLKVHSDAKPFTCNECGLCYTLHFTLGNLKNHIESFHVDDKFQEKKKCPVCKEMIKRASIHSHIKMHTGESRIECKKCGKILATKHSLKEHIQVMHATESNIFKCETCGNKYKTKRILQGHLLTHTDNRRVFTCKVCNKTFLQNRNLKNHQRVHTGEQPYVCHRCGECFYTSTLLKKHELVHTGETSFKCGICPKAFMNRSLLRSHMSVHYKSRLSKNGEEESDTELPSRKGRYIHLKTLAALQQSGATENTMKNFTILIKRKSYIERAARDGFTGPFTYVQYRCNGKLAGQWVKASKQ